MLAQPRFRTARCGQRACANAEPSIWNKVPAIVLQTISLNIFKRVPVVLVVFLFTCSEYNFFVTLAVFCMCLDRFFIDVQILHVSPY